MHYTDNISLGDAHIFDCSTYKLGHTVTQTILPDETITYALIDTVIKYVVIIIIIISSYSII